MALTKDGRAEAVILELLGERAESSSICPSDAARAAFPEAWREEMGRVREVAFRLARKGVVRVTQKDREVSPEGLRGPVRIRRGPRFGAE